MYTRNHSRCVTKIQRAWRAFQLARRCCPISLCRIPPSRAIEVGRQVFDVNYLAKFIQMSGDYRCPITRAPIAPHILHRIEDMTDVPVWTSRSKFTEEGKAERERSELVSYYSNAIDRHVGTLVLALLDENQNSCDVLATVIRSLRQLTSVMVQYATVNRPQALTALQETQSTVNGLVSFHTTTQGLAVRFLARFSQDVRNNSS